MADFKIAHGITQKVEGGYANNKNDNGGETYRGIARKYWPNWAGWRIVDMLRISQQSTFPACLSKQPVLNELVDKFYKQNFWDTLTLDLMECQTVANELYDTAVNMGVEIAANFLQRSLNAYNLNAKRFKDIPVDNNAGPVTIKTFNSIDERGKKIIYKMLNCLQGARYMDIVERNHSQEEFINSWFGRVFEAA